MKSLREQLIDIKKTLFGNDKCISKNSSIKSKDKISEGKLNKKDYIQCPICGDDVIYKNINMHIKQTHKNANIRITKLSGASSKDIISGDSSLYAEKNNDKVTPEQKTLKEKIQRQGYGDGAHIPGSKITKYGKY